MSKWEQVTWVIIPPKLGPHKWTRTKTFSWEYCDRCGIMGMKHGVKHCSNCKKEFRLCDGG